MSNERLSKSLQKCGYCKSEPARLQRVKHPRRKACAECFFANFESEVLQTLTAERLCAAGETVALAVSGGKDSTVLLHLLHTLNARHALGLKLVLVAVDEGIAGYRDHALAAVRENAKLYALPLVVLSYADLFGIDMDEVVRRRGVKCSCTYCGVFRRRAMDLGAARAGADRLYTGHNADDVAETVLLNALKGDAQKLVGCSATVSGGQTSAFKKCKPLKYCFEKEIVLYAHYKKLIYFSTECTYSKEAFRGPLKELMKNVNELRPGLLEDMIRATQRLALKGGADRRRLSCKECGEITSNSVCKVCLFKEELKGPPRTRKLAVEMEETQKSI